jgi:hypothetical protein
MIDAITMTNSGKPIGRWVDETQASPFMSVTWLHLGAHVSLHNLFLVQKNVQPQISTRWG